MRKLQILLPSLLTFLLSATTLAQETNTGDMVAPAATPASAPVAPVGAATGYPDEYIARPLGISMGMLQVKVPVAISLSKSRVGKPISVPLDVRYGVSDVLELRLTHGTGLCLTGEKNGCPKVYNDVNVGATYSFMGRGSSLELGAIVDLTAVSIDPSMLMAKVGVGINYAPGTFMLMALPQLGIGLNKRDAGNKESISIPVWFAIQPTPQLAPYLVTGISGPVDKFGDNYSIPLGIGANFLLQHGLDVGAEFTMTALTGAKNDTPTDTRTLTIYAAWRNL